MLKKIIKQEGLFNKQPVYYATKFLTTLGLMALSIAFLLTIHFFWFQMVNAVLLAQSVFACGSLIAPDGDVRLTRASTFVAWHNDVEHYLTSFAYQGSEPGIGWIVPLPAVPDAIQDGGAWTLQRLERETHPQRFATDAPQAASMGSAQVLQQAQIEALNVTVIRGSGDEIVNWATHNGFFLSAETRAHLLGYAKGSPIFLAAKYDTRLAQARHQLQGDGVPLLITLKTAHPWVPLEVLALEGQQVQADLYFLTDMPLNISDVNAKIGQSAVGSEIPGATGFKVAFQEPMNPQLYHDLSSDRNMGWVWPQSWLTYLSLDAPEPQVTYDLGVSEAGVIRLAPYGTAPMAVVDGVRSKDLPAWIPTLPLHTPQWVEDFLIAALTIVATVFLIRRSRKSAKRLAKS